MVKKRIISLFISVTIIISLFAFSIEAEDEEYVIKNVSEIEFLQNIGVLGEKFDPSKTITREEFSEIIIQIMYFNSDFSSQMGFDNVPLFADVTIENQYYAYIKACKDLGIINGNANRNFYPENNIKMIEAITMIVNALGYSQYATAYGGYPTGYYKIAKETGITKGIEISESGVVTGDDIAKILYNSLFSDLVTISSISESNITTKVNVGVNILTERLGIKAYDARVIDNGITSLSTTCTLDPERVVLKAIEGGESISAYVGKTNIGQYIGSRVNVYIKTNRETARDEIVYFSIHSKSKETLINADRITNVTNSYIEYEKDENSDNYLKIKFGLNPPVLIFNGVHIVDYSSMLLNPDDGFIRCVDIDNDNNVDLIDIISFNCYGSIDDLGAARNIVVDSVGDYINCKYNPNMNIKITDDVANYKFIMNDEITTIDELPIDAIVSVAESPKLIDGKKYYFLAVCDEFLDGKIKEKNVMENKITIDDNKYSLSSSLTKINENFISRIKTNADLTIYFDITGKISFFNSWESSKNYAYLIDVKIINKFDNFVLTKLYLPEQGIVELELKSKTIIDGVECKTPEAQLEKLQERPIHFLKKIVEDGVTKITKSPTLTDEVTTDNYVSKPIIIETNTDGYITRIDTEIPNYDEDTNAKNIYASMTPIRYSDDEVNDDAALKSGLRSPKTVKLNTGTSSLDGRFFLTGSTVIMNVPDIDVYGIPELSAYSSNSVYSFNYDIIKFYEKSKKSENYRLMSTGEFDSEGAYDIQAYDIDPQTGVAGLAIVRGVTNTITVAPWGASNPMCAFLRITEAYDEETEGMVKKIYYTSDGITELSATANFDELPFYYKYLVYGCSLNDTPYQYPIPPLKKGDIIRVLASGGRLTHVERVANIDDLNALKPMAWYPSGPTTPYTTGGGKQSKNFPFYLSEYISSIGNSYVVGIAIPKEKNGNNVTTYIPKTTLNEISENTPTSFSEQFFKVSGVSLMTITIEENGAVNVREGYADDIITAKQTGDIKGASRFLYWHRLLAFNQIIIINDKR